MKNLLLIIVLLVFACKNEKKDKIDSTKLEEVKKASTLTNEEVLNKLILPNHNLWVFNRLSFEEDLDSQREGTFKMIRTSIDETAYAIVKDIPVIFGSKYRLSVLVKKGQKGNLFGLRVMGEYPNRIDAVFDLKNGFVNDVKNSGNFIVGKAEITALEDNWFRCSIITEYDADLVKIIMGPTSGLGRTITWEANTNDYCENYIIPSSLTLVEISN